MLVLCYAAKQRIECFQEEQVACFWCLHFQFCSDVYTSDIKDVKCLVRSASEWLKFFKCITDFFAFLKVIIG